MEASGVAERLAKTQKQLEAAVVSYSNVQRDIQEIRAIGA